MLGALLLGYRASTCEALSGRCRAHEDQPHLIWAFRLALLLLWLAFELKYWIVAAALTLVVFALTLWVQVERGVRGRS